RVTVCAQHFVLCFEDSCDGAHQGTAFAGKVRVYFLLEIRFEQVSGANADTERNGFRLGVTRSILEHGVACVNAFTLKEQPAYGCSRSLRGNEDHVDIRRRDDARLFFEGDAEPM